MMKRGLCILAMVCFILFSAAIARLKAADIEAVLDSDAGTSGFSLKNLSALEKVRMNALGQINAAGSITAPDFVSSVATGTQPYAATSTTLNTNLNADLWDSQQLPALSNGKYLTNNGSALSWDTPPTTHTLTDVYNTVSGLTIGSILRATGATTYGWSTATYPGTTTANNILYSSAANTVGELAPSGSNTFLKWSGSAYSWDTPPTGSHTLTDTYNTVSGLTIGQMLRATGATTYGWTTATYPATTTANNLLYSSAANTVGELAPSGTDTFLKWSGSAYSWDTAPGGSAITALTSDVTATGPGSAVATIANSAVTYAKMQNVSATDKILGRVSSGSGVVEEISCTAAGRALIDDNDAAGQRSTLGLDTMATQNAGSVSISGGSVTGITDLAVADGGTGVSSSTAYGLLAGGTTATGAQQSITNSATTGTILQGAGTNALAGWSTATYPGTTTANNLLYSSAANTVGELAPSGTNSYLQWTGAAYGWDIPLVILAGTPGAAGTKETWQVLTADAASNNAVAPATVMSTTGLSAGIYLFEYTVIWQSAAVGTGINFQVDYTGVVTEVTTRRETGTTGAAASTGVADGVAATLTGQLLEHDSTRSDSGSLGPNTGVDTANSNIIDHIRGVITVSGAGNLDLKAGTENAGTNITVQSGTCLVLRKLN
jgi:hypothetical protein